MFSAAPPAPTPIPATTPASVTLLTPAARRDVLAAIRERTADHSTAGTIIGVIDADGQQHVVSYTAHGRRPIGLDTQFEVGSVSKTFTAALLADMVRRGEVQLTDPVASLLPAGTVIPSRDGRPITLEDLATHRSGLPRDPMDLFGDGPVSSRTADVAKAYAAYTPQRMLAYLRTYALPTTPGQEVQYSNLGMGLLGYALSVRAGEPYEQLLRERVLGPLGLSATGLTTDPAPAGLLAPSTDGDGVPQPRADFGAVQPAGGVRSSMRDLLRYAAANLASATPVEQDLAAARAPRAELGPGDQVGLAWISSTFGAAKVVWHDGRTFGATSFVGIDAARHEAVVVLNASSSDAEDLGVHLLDPTTPITPEPVVSPLSPSALAAFAGRYRTSDGVTITLRRTGTTLTADIPLADPVILRPLGADHFFSRLGYDVTFTHRSSGAITGFSATLITGDTLRAVRVGR